MSEGVREAVAVSLGRGVAEEAAEVETAGVNVGVGVSREDIEGLGESEGMADRVRVGRGEREGRREAVENGEGVLSLLPIEAVAVGYLVLVGVGQAVESRARVCVGRSVGLIEKVGVPVGSGDAVTLVVEVDTRLPRAEVLEQGETLGEEEEVG